MMEKAPTALIRPPPSSPVQGPHFTAAPPYPFGLAILNAPPPPFTDNSSSVDPSPLEFVLAFVILVTLPTLICTLIFTVKCPSRRRRSDRASGPPSITSEAPHESDVSVSDLKFQKDTHVKEIGSECPVCLSVLADGEEVRQLTACKHSFHASCIDLWLENHSNCPICRAPVAVNRPKSSAPGRDDDLQQGLPDASALV